MKSTNRSENCFESEKGIHVMSVSSLETESDTWFTSPEAAMFLGISVQALLNKVSGGKVPFYKFGRRNRYKKSELEELLSQNRKGPMYGYKKGN